MDAFLKARDNDLDFFYKNPLYLDIQDELGHSLLHYAILGNAREVFYYLLNNNINTNIVNKRGETPLFEALRKNKKEMVISLLNKYASVNVFNNEKESPLFIALFKGELTLVKLLIENGADYLHLNNKGESALFAASKGGSIECFNYLLTLPKMLKKLDKNDNTLLHLASSFSNELFLKYLLEKGENPHLVNKHLEPAIFVAARLKLINNVKLLTKYGAYIDVVNKYGNTISDLALENEDVELLDFLTSHRQTSVYRKNIESNPLRAAVLLKADEKIAGLLLKHPQKKDQYQLTPLDYALKSKNKHLIKLLK